MAANDAKQFLSENMDDWTKEDVCQWLKDLDLPQEVVDAFFQNRINGKVLQKLEDKYFDRMPAVMVGDRITIIDERDNYLKSRIAHADPGIELSVLPSELEIMPKLTQRFESKANDNVKPWTNSNRMLEEESATKVQPSQNQIMPNIVPDFELEQRNDSSIISLNEITVFTETDVIGNPEFGIHSDSIEDTTIVTKIVSSGELFKKTDETPVKQPDEKLLSERIDNLYIEQNNEIAAETLCNFSTDQKNIWSPEGTNILFAELNEETPPDGANVLPVEQKEVELPSATVDNIPAELPDHEPNPFDNILLDEKEESFQIDKVHFEQPMHETADKMPSGQVTDKPKRHKNIKELLEAKKRMNIPKKPKQASGPLPFVSILPNVELGNAAKISKGAVIPSMIQNVDSSNKTPCEQKNNNVENIEISQTLISRSESMPPSSEKQASPSKSANATNTVKREGIPKSHKKMVQSYSQFKDKQHPSVSSRNIQKYQSVGSKSSQNLDTCSLMRQSPSEILRKFDTPIDITFKYKKGAKLSCVETRPGGNLLLPIHQFVNLECSNIEKSKSEFATSTVQFSCACLNDRANGTIHFGISSETQNSYAIYGTIVGVTIQTEVKEYQNFLTETIKSCFSENQIDIALNCIRPAVFIEVIEYPYKPSQFVIEVDVLPCSNFCKDEIFYLDLPSCKIGRSQVYRIMDGNLHALLAEEEMYFKKLLPDLVKQRGELESESKVLQKIDTNLHQKFVHLLCDGDESLRGDHYHILIVNKPAEHMNDDYMKKSLLFLADIEWKVIFDFDADAKVCQFIQDQIRAIKIAQTDDFSQCSESNIKNPERLKLFLEDIKNSVSPLWLFVNGYSPSGEQQLSRPKWRKNRSEGLKEAVRFFNIQIPKGRATVVFMLLSKEMDVLVEASEEFCSIFSDQWMCVAENEETGKPWQEELLRRNCLESSDSDKTVFGMPWFHVQESVSRILGPKKRSICEIPTSSGTYVSLFNKIIFELEHIDILGSFECDNAEIVNYQQNEEFEKHKIDVENNFYKGNTVSWWNFWFPWQVCERDILDDIMKQVRSALQSDDDIVGKVFLYHQPGAGGTTTAKHVLWNFRKEYRCGIIKNISNIYTAQQIWKFFEYEDNNPNPVLLLLDNPDSEKANLLHTNLVEMIKRNQRLGYPRRIVCVFLVCVRQTKIPSSQYDPKKLVLKHDLFFRELEWFKEKNHLLIQEFKKKEHTSVHPRLLISFNLMKEGFSKDFLSRTVKEFVKNITDKSEKKLLKYVCLLNAYDLECRPIPTSSFDGLMIEIPWTGGGGLRFGNGAKLRRWETKLSSDILILLNETSKQGMGYIHSLRITNMLLAQEILNILRTTEGLQLSDIALEFFDCAEIFNCTSFTKNNLLQIIQVVLKRRQYSARGKPETDFAPLVQKIVDVESHEKAIAVMTKALDLIPDPCLNQQLARLYIKVQNWEKAKSFAKKAVEDKPDNSFFWDTYGRIYEQQLAEEYQKIVRETKDWFMSDMTEVIQIALNGIKMFRKVQETSEQEKTSGSGNKSGFYGELQMIINLLDCLSSAFPSKDNLRQFILDELYVPADCEFLRNVDGQNYMEDLKSLDKLAKKAMTSLADELIQLRDDETTVEEFRSNYAKCYDAASLVSLKENLHSYFGEDGNNVPNNLNDKDKCEFRRRRIFRLAGHNIGSIFDLRWKDDGLEKLEEIQKIVLENLKTPYANFSDYLDIISVNLAMLSVDAEYLPIPEMKYEKMVHYSQKLYELRSTSYVIHLEPYLFFAMFNWPRKNTQQYSAPKRVIEKVLMQWRDDYFLKYPRQKDEGKPVRKKDTTMFFLANGSDMASISTDYRGSKNSKRTTDMSFWRLPETLRNLQRFDGVLSGDGNEVSVCLQCAQGNKAFISIPTSLPISTRTMWNKKVYFVIGFSWFGPKAFDVTLEDPSLELNISLRNTISLNKCPPIKDMVFTRRDRILMHEDFLKERKHLRNQLDQINALKEKKNRDTGYCYTTDELQLLNRQSKLEEDEKKLLDERKIGMTTKMPEVEG